MSANSVSRPNGGTSMACRKVNHWVFSAGRAVGVPAIAHLDAGGVVAPNDPLHPNMAGHVVPDRMLRPLRNPELLGKRQQLVRRHIALIGCHQHLELWQCVLHRRDNVGVMLAEVEAIDPGAERPVEWLQVEHSCRLSFGESATLPQLWSPGGALLLRHVAAVFRLFGSG